MKEKNEAEKLGGHEAMKGINDQNITTSYLQSFGPCDGEPGAV
jgi:hypothetical protein